MPCCGDDFVQGQVRGVAVGQRGRAGRGRPQATDDPHGHTEQQQDNGVPLGGGVEPAAAWTCPAGRAIHESRARTRRSARARRWREAPKDSPVASAISRLDKPSTR